ncbi:MAG: PP2C family protein-serine/threonine phosphatase [Acidimicrobiales bacterium]
MAPHESDDMVQLIDAAARTAPGDVLGLLEPMCQVLGASALRLHVADYSLRRLQQIARTGPVGSPQPVSGTLLGRTFTSSEIVVSGDRPTVVMVPLVEGTNRLGVLELDFDRWDGEVPSLLDPVVTLFAMTWILKGRYSDALQRARRSKPLSIAAEVQWELLPPLSCATDRVSVSGIMEPAYDIGGDSFDYSFETSRLDFTIVDAVGHGLAAVSMSAAAINSLRNSRRTELSLTEAYERADQAIALQFGDSNYVTALIASLDLRTGTLRWVNAGHLVPMLVRNESYTGTLDCAPSMPLGLGGDVVEVAETSLQRGDRVLFYTDGISESRSSEGSFFGDERLADFLVRSALEHLPVQETVRHLTESVIDFNDEGLRDDATMFLVEWHGTPD